MDKKSFRVSLDIEMDFNVAEKEDDDNFAIDTDFNKIIKEIIVDCMDCNSEKIEFFKIVEIKE